jgi:hypothetical protein
MGNSSSLYTIKERSVVVKKIHIIFRNELPTKDSEHCRLFKVFGDSGRLEQA